MVMQDPRRGCFEVFFKGAVGLLALFGPARLLVEFAQMVTRRWTRARGLLLLPVPQTLSHSRLRGRNLLRRGPGRNFRVNSAPNPLF
jgi:hypothetical protein